MIVVVELLVDGSWIPQRSRGGDPFTYDVGRDLVGEVLQAMADHQLRPARARTQRGGEVLGERLPATAAYQRTPAGFAALRDSVIRTGRG